MNAHPYRVRDMLQLTSEWLEFLKLVLIFRQTNEKQQWLFTELII